MVYQLERIERDVRVALDENGISAALTGEGDTDALTLDEIIRSKIEEGARIVESEAPTHLLDRGHNFGDAIYWRELESGYVLLPDDFMRLIAFRMSDWERTVYSAIGAGDAQYQRQSSRFKGVRGNCQKPVCAIVSRPEGLALEFYSCKSREAQVVEGVYLPYPRVDSDGGIEICERCYRGVVNMVAALVSTAIGEAERGSALAEMAKRSLV